jgi:hypothetical protein
MNSTSPQPLSAESEEPPPNGAPVTPLTSESETVEVQRRFRLAGSGMASRELQSAIMTFLHQRGS